MVKVEMMLGEILTIAGLIGALSAFFIAGVVVLNIVDQYHRRTMTEAERDAEDEAVQNDIYFW